MAKRFTRFLIIFLLVVLVLIGFPPGVQAADFRTGQDVTVPAGETVNGDLYIAGNTITIAGTVNGDIFTAGSSVAVSGTVNGGLTAAGQTVDVSGNVTGGVRLAGQTVSFRGSSGRDVVVAASNVNVQNGARVGADLVANGANVQMNGAVNRNVLGNADQMTINGAVGGNVDTNVNNLVLGPAANITGNVTYSSQNEARVEPGARVGGATTRNEPVQREPDRPFGFSRILLGIGGFLMALLTGIVLILLMENRIAVIADAIGYNILGSLGWGALVLFLTPLIILAIFITVIGIPVSLILLAIYLIALYISQIFVGLFIGRLILGQYERPASRLALIGALALGLFILNVLMLVPYIGVVVSLATAIFGLGALFVAARTPGEQIISGY